jgi:hypothetical protein
MAQGGLRGPSTRVLTRSAGEGTGARPRAGAPEARDAHRIAGAFEPTLRENRLGVFPGRCRTALRVTEGRIARPTRTRGCSDSAP